MAEGVEQDGVGGLWTNAGKGQQTGAQGVCGRGGQGRKRSVKLLVQQDHKRLQRGRLAGVKAGGLDQPLKVFLRKRAQTVHGQGSSSTQVVE